MDPNTSKDIVDALERFSDSYDDFATLIEAICYLSGFIIFAHAIDRARSLKEKGSGAGAGIILSCAVGVALMFMPSTLSSIAYTFGFGGCSTNEIIDYIQECNESSGAFKPVIELIKFYGIFAVMRGFFMLNQNAKQMAHFASHGGPTKGQAIIHICAGFLCVYILDFIQVLDATFGFSMASYFM